MVLVLKALPVEAGPLSDVVEQVHVQEQGDVIPQAVAAVHVDIEGGEVPDLDDRQAAQDVDPEGRAADKAVLHMVQQRVVAPYDIDEDQVVDQFQILDLLLLFLQRVAE